VSASGGLGGWTLAFARRVLERSDLRRIVEPTIADLRHEHRARVTARDGAGAFRVRLSGHLTLVWLLWLLHVRARARRLASSAPWLLVAAVAASLVATPALSGVARSLAMSHVVHVATGVVVATLLATTAPRTLRRSALVSLALVALPLALVAGWGDEVEGARRWLRVGPLYLHVAALVAPAWAVAAAGLAASPRRLLLSCGAVLALLVVTRDLAAVLLYAAIAVAASHGRFRWVRPALAVVCAVAAWAAALRQPAVSAVPHVEGALGLVRAHAAPDAVIAMAALAVIVVGAWGIALRLPTGFRARASRAIAAHLLLASVGIFVGGTVPFVSYGGSGVVAGMAMLGLLASLRSDRAVARARP
jgi:hypothetical protein